ncbi:MAG: Riboflavin synthase [Clostridium sp.]|jgi:riboflavin synthase
MFTGLIEEIGTVYQNNSIAGNLSICAKKVLEHITIGDSIAVNGVCLTVTDFNCNFFIADVTPETLQRSTLGNLHPGDPVNLERPLAANGRLGGHFVSGHVDSVGWVSCIQKKGNSTVMKIKAPPELLDLIVEKGSIAVDGISLTVAATDHDTFSVSIIPHTGSQTTIVHKKVGDPVNLETDLIGKYVHKFIHRDSHSSNITLDWLQQNGF